MTRDLDSFIFTMQEFAKELISLVDAIHSVCVLDRTQSWVVAISRWLPFRKTSSGKAMLRRRISTRFALRSSPGTAKFPKIRPHAPRTLQTPGPSHATVIGKFKARLWRIGTRLQQSDIKYALKAGVSIVCPLKATVDFWDIDCWQAVLAAPAFFDATRPIFLQYRGQWALITCFVVLSPTIGAVRHFICLPAFKINEWTDKFSLSFPHYLYSHWSFDCRGSHFTLSRKSVHTGSFWSYLLSSLLLFDD